MTRHKLHRSFRRPTVVDDLKHQAGEEVDDVQGLSGEQYLCLPNGLGMVIIGEADPSKKMVDLLIMLSFIGFDHGADDHGSCFMLRNMLADG